jgi:hypothetical protein
MKSRLYKYRNVGFQFVPAYRKWTFRNNEGKGRLTLIQECPGGRPTAAKIAVQVSASLKRSKTVQDGLAEAAINRIVRPVVVD